MFKLQSVWTPVTVPKGNCEHDRATMSANQLLPLGEGHMRHLKLVLRPCPSVPSLEPSFCAPNRNECRHLQHASNLTTLWDPSDCILPHSAASLVCRLASASGSDMQAVPGSEETFLDFTVFFLNNQETQNSMYKVMCVCVYMYNC